MRTVWKYMVCILPMLFSLNADMKNLYERRDNNQKKLRMRTQEEINAGKQSRDLMYAAYFSGTEIIRYERFNSNLNHFTVGLFVKPEGGQINNVPILKIFNHCSVIDDAKLVIGVTENNLDKDLRIYFSLQTELSRRNVTLMSHDRILTNEWFHVVAMYDGLSMQLFVNQAKVEVSYDQKGSFLTNTFHECITLEVGGNSATYETFRGWITDINVWNIAKSHRQLVVDVTNFVDANLVFRESFRDNSTHGKKHKYYGINGLNPDIFKKKVFETEKEIPNNIPTCGITECDSPDIIKHYSYFTKQLLSRKKIKYRLINLANDDGSNPMFTEKQIRKNNRVLNEVFTAYNISLELYHHTVNNSMLRNKTVILKCYGHCDGGALGHCNVRDKPRDCYKQCFEKNIGNGECNPECNKPTEYTINKNIIGLDFNWDGGDCCDPKSPNISHTCYDYTSPWRSFINEAELKVGVGLNNRNVLNLFPVNTKVNVLGKSSFPWIAKSYTVHGGIVVNAENFKNGITGNTIHEIGHAFGLWHVHKGVTEIPQCDDTCAERFPSMKHGDLCSDTNPTPLNPTCKNTVADEKCGFTIYTKVPYKNYMSYSSGSCTSEFTKQQTGRMHCYIDRYYQRWQTENVPPSIIPLPPKILNFNRGKLELSWISPMGLGFDFAKRNCAMCSKDGFNQYASSAFSPADSGNLLHLSHQFTGPPDARHLCDVDYNTWIPNDGCKNIPECFIEVKFEEEVVPNALKIWVVYNAKHSIKNIQLIHADRDITNLGPATCQCDVPYTRQIKVSKPVASIRIYVTKKLVGLDSIMLTSAIDHQHCKACEIYQPVYKIYRNPQFHDGPFRMATTRNFVDQEVKVGVKYEYKVSTVSGGKESNLSPPLIFKSTDGFCGNGRIEKHLGEECDDRNVRNGDGCNIECQKEKVFDCRLEPSLCYRHDKDGVCDEFEKHHNIKECGFYTPTGYTDQWAINVTGPQGQSNKHCDESILAGKPELDLTCVGGYDDLEVDAWRPCKRKYGRRKPIKVYQIEATFLKKVFPSAVIIHLASDGALGRRKSNIYIEIKDITTGKYHRIHERQVFLNCKDNPLSVSVRKDLGAIKTNVVRVSFNTAHWRSAYSGIAIRFKQNSCNSNEQFNSNLKLCLPEHDRNKTVGCKPFHVKNAIFRCSGTSDYDICNVTCNRGYAPMTFTSTCLIGEWRNKYGNSIQILKGLRHQLSGLRQQDALCKPVHCGPPQSKHALFIDCNRTTLGSTCSFQCVNSAKLFGNKSTIRCTEDGFWDYQGSYCYKSCDLLRNGVNNVLYNGDNMTLHGCVSQEYINESKDSVHMGTRCRFECKIGYEAVLPKIGNMPIDPNTIYSYCDENGRWKKDGSCEKITCPSLSTYHQLLYTCTDGNRFESRCSTACFTSKNITHLVVCLQNGSWSSDFNGCSTRNECKIPLESETINVTLCVATKSGESCKPSCYSDTKNGIVLDIAFKGKEEYDNDVSIYCMPNGDWLPPPDQLICVKPCLYDYVGNDVCDCENNNKHCKYDGGDCCPNSPVNACQCVQPTNVAKLKSMEIIMASGEHSGDELVFNDDTENGEDDYF